jgi:hypothetical protein
MTYQTGKHEFVTVPSAKTIEVNDDINVSFQADSVYFNGLEMSNDDFQMLMNVYVKRQQQSKKLTKRVNEIRENDTKKDIYSACDLAHKELNIR